MPEDSSQPQPTSTQKSINWKNIIIGIVIGAILVGLGVLIFLLLQPSPETTSTGTTKKATPSAKISTPSAKKDETADWEIYENKNYGFFLKYPNNFKVHNLIEAPFYTLEDPIAFGIVLTQDIYINLGQTPVIKVQLVQTDKTINQILDQLKTQIENAKESMTDPEHAYYGANPPKINSIEVVQTGSIEATKVERYQGPGAPNAELLEYYIKSPDYVFILTANYGTNNPDVGQEGTLEKEVLSKIISTFRFTN